MSAFAVIVYPVRIEPHPNADLLECAVIGEYRSVVRKGEFKDGDLVAYIPEGSLVPLAILQELGLEGKLAGPEHNRVKAIKLRGMLSQGICYPARSHWKVGDDVTQELGITKCIPPVPVHMAGEVEYLGSGFIQAYDVEPYKKYPDLLDEGEPVVITEKIHGCLRWDTTVATDQGLMKIGTIVNQRRGVKVASYNLETGLVEYKPILAYHRMPRQRPWVRIHVRSIKRGAALRSVTCTDDHLFYTPERGWVEAGLLSVGDKVYMLVDAIDSEARQVILGTLLGDGTINKPRPENRRGVSLVQSVQQSEYFEYKLKWLSGIVRESKGARGGFPGSLATRRAYVRAIPAVDRLIAEYCEVDGKKRITPQWVDELGPLGLAIWYMDDGTLSKPPGQRPRAVIAMNGFSLDEVCLIQKMLSRRFGIEATIRDHGEGPRLCLSADGTERFCDLIYPYVPGSMKYKLPEKYLNRRCVLEDAPPPPAYQAVVETEVVSVEHDVHRGDNRHWSGYDDQYDLTVADNHNYFASNVLVHNSCCICGAFPEPVETPAGPRQAFVASKGMAASGRAFKSNEANARNVYVRASAKYGLTDKALILARRYRAPVTLYGEVYGKGVQDLHYGAQEPQYALFDIYVGRCGQGRFLDHADLMALAGDIGLPTVRVLYEGPFSREKLYELAEGKESYSGKSLHVREGVVVRPVHEAIRRTRATGIETFQRAVLKHVGEGYLLRKGQTTEFE